MKQLILSANCVWNIINFRTNLIRGLQQAGYAITVVAPTDAHVEKLKDLGCAYQPIFLDKGKTNPAKDLYSIIQFYKTYRRLRPDAILNFTIKNNIYSTLAAACLRIPVINNITGLGYLFINNTLSSHIAKFLYRLTQKHAAKVFFQNPDDRDVFLQHHLVPKQLTDLLPGSGIDLTQFTPVGTPQSDITTFLLFGRMLYDKGIQEYVDAARMLQQKYPQARFLLLGPIDTDNPQAIPAQQIQAWQAQGIIEYLPGRAEVKDIIAQADCVVLPSYREGLPRALLEASAMAKPMITTDVPGCRAVVAHGVNGYLCQARNARDLAEKLAQFIQLPNSARKTMGAAARKKVAQHFDVNLVIQQYLAALDQIL
jgi:glycosyltransferase involved in cell wall biosynthesis